jgi:hypothetical protein
MAQVDPPLDLPSSPTPSSPTKAAPALPRGLVLLALSVLLSFIVIQGRSLWHEWTVLQREMSRVRQTAVVGYHNITPNPSYAQKPPNWFHDEGEYTLLWSGWKHGDGHRWFRVGRGEVDRERISLPLGRDVIQAIDYPMVETDGGVIWDRIPLEATVVGQELSGVDCVYPMQVLDKVEVVNDEIEGRPFLVVYNPMVEKKHSVVIYEPMVAGHRVTMGLSGYFLDRQPMLYDRGTESLWVHEKESLRAIAGQHKGVRLRRIGQPIPTLWGDWRTRHPRSRLVVGADRSKRFPTF